MYQEILTPRTSPVITPEQLSSFGRFDCPPATCGSPAVANPDYTLLETFIDAATDQVETMAATACLTEQVLLTLDFFPGQADPRQMLNYELSYGYGLAYWWLGFPTKESIELIRRPVIVPSGSPLINLLAVNYNDENGNPQVFDPSNYTVGYNKITLNVGCCWPLTDRRQDCIQITYWAGHTVTPSRLQTAVMFLAAHYYENRQIVTVAPTSEIHMTLCSLLSSYKSYRLPR